MFFIKILAEKAFISPEKEIRRIKRKREWFYYRMSEKNNEFGWDKKWK